MNSRLNARLKAASDSRFAVVVVHVQVTKGYPAMRNGVCCWVEARVIHTQIVTSAFRVIPVEWNKLPRLNIVVSVDGLQADHDERRKPATYERILKNIDGTKVTIHFP